MKHKIAMIAMVLSCLLVLCACTSEPNGGGTTQTPGAATPMAEPAESPQQTDDGGATSSPGNTMMTIPDFAEGTETSEADIPEVVAALQEVHEGATITKVTHATYLGQQTYCVEYSDQDGTIKVAYIGADGSILVDNLSEPITASGATGGEGGDTSGGAAGGSGAGSEGGTGGGTGSGSGGTGSGSGGEGGTGGTGGSTGSTGSGNGNAA